MTVNQETFSCTSTAWEPTVNLKKSLPWNAGDGSATEITEIAGVLIALESWFPSDCAWKFTMICVLCGDCMS